VGSVFTGGLLIPVIGSFFKQTRSTLPSTQ